VRFRFNDTNILDVKPDPETGTIDMTVIGVTRRGELTGDDRHVAGIDVEAVLHLARALNNIARASEAAARSFGRFRDNPKGDTRERRTRD
jgi:hypothetical protein